MESKTLEEALKINGLDNLDRLNSLPKSIKRRVQALKKLQVEGIKVESEFYERVHQLEVEMASQFNAIYEKRKAIVTGEHEPTDEEANFPILHGLTEDDAKKVMEASEPEPSERTKGIPDFWLKLLKDADTIGEIIEEHDEPILKHLIDITVENGTDPNCFKLTFHFTPNEYFKQTELTKWYALQLTPDEDDPFGYDGPMVTDVKGTVIEWNDGKDVTKKVIKKKQKSGPEAGQFITKTVKADSFFNFFDEVKSKDASSGDNKEMGEEHMQMLSDFEIGQLFRDQIIPHAVLYYTGEVPDDDVDYDDDLDEEDDEEEHVEDGDDSDED